MKTRIVGIDPGSQITGYGIIDVSGNQYTYVDCGIIRTKKTTPGERLQTIFLGLQDILKLHVPTHAAIEQVFMKQNVQSALVLGQARGVALVALALQGISIAEYTARQVKQAVVGYGNADKQQVQHMIRCLLNLQHTPTVDAADALAIAVCHANSARNLQLLNQH